VRTAFVLDKLWPSILSGMTF